MITAYFLIDFGKTIYSEDVKVGDMIKNETIDDVLLQICMLSDLTIPDLDKVCVYCQEFEVNCNCPDCPTGGSS